MVRHISLFLLGWIWLTALACDAIDWMFWATYRVPVSAFPIIAMWVVLLVMIDINSRESRVDTDARKGRLDDE